jgi:hypothetical protein
VIAISVERINIGSGAGLPGFLWNNRVDPVPGSGGSRSTAATHTDDGSRRFSLSGSARSRRTRQRQSRRRRPSTELRRQ